MSSVNRKPVRRKNADAYGHLVHGAGWSLILLTPVNIIIFLTGFLLFHYGNQSYLLLFSYVIGGSISCTIAGAVVLADQRRRKRSEAESVSKERKESILCNVCGAIVPYGEASCPVCLSRLLKACASCGVLSAINVRNCPRCGNAL